MSVVLDDVGVTRRLSNGAVEQVRWDDLVEVAIVTTDAGPWAEDVFFVLAGSGDAGCVVPQSVEASAALLERLQTLPGFDDSAVIAAMASTRGARFVCWRRGG